MTSIANLKMLKKGAESWNRWRHDHPKIAPDLRKAMLGGWDLTGVDLGKANLRGANLVKTNLVEADLSGASLVEADLTDSNLSEAKLKEAFLVAADLHRANLYGADLSGALLDGADFSEANLCSADLRRADLWVTHFTGANLSGAAFGRARLGYTVFGSNDLSEVKGLDSVIHSSSSIIGIDTIYRSKGSISESFLRGCGVPDDFIVYMRSLAANPIDFYSCFISYSSKDDAFAAELHAKLQTQHVRCWKDSEDLRIGDKFQDAIDSAIRLHDKLLIVLSENSINSSWVEWEVRKALKKEQEQGSAVLFPVRLDDAVMETPYPWAAEVRKRHIGDFRKWKDLDSFQKSLDRLLRDLKSQDPKPK
jgi:hypothetical protein